MSYNLRSPWSPRNFEEWLWWKKQQEETRKQAHEAVELAKRLGWKPPPSTGEEGNAD